MPPWGEVGEAKPETELEEDPDEIPELGNEPGNFEDDVDMDEDALFGRSDDEETGNPVAEDDADMGVVEETTGGQQKFDLSASTKIKHDIRKMIEDLEKAEPENTKAMDNPRSTPSAESKMDVAEAYSPRDS